MVGSEGKEIDNMMRLMQKFNWVDYVVFVLMLAISAVVGVYWGFIKKQTTQQDYLLGGRNMQVVPVAMSLVASFVSGITLVRTPTEAYIYGMQYAYVFIAILMMVFVMNQVYLPVFHYLKFTSNYEYLSMRFDNRVRLFGSIVFAINLIGWLPITIYVPALAFNQVTGVGIHVITPIVCLVCIFYTSAGGLQAVVWADVIQITAMFGAMALVAIKGTLDVGGFGVVWQRNVDSGRIEAPDWDPSPFTRHSMWNLVIGGLIYWTQANTVNQTMMQRYLSLPTLRKAKWAVFLLFIGLSCLHLLCQYCGLLIYAKYHDCDPLTTKLAKVNDQLLPLLVMDVLGDFPGLLGVFVAGIFSAALSSLSTSLNSMSAVVLEDFYKPFNKKELTNRQSGWVMKGVVVGLGVLCLGLVFLVEKIGTIIQLTITLDAMTGGPQFGVFTMGLLMPWVDATGALVGGLTGLAAMSWWCLSAQFATAAGEIVHPHKPMSTAGCTYSFNATDAVIPYSTSLPSEVNPLLRVSYMWFTLSGTVITIFVGAAVSCINRVRGRPHVAPAPILLGPQLRRFYKDLSHPSGEMFGTHDHKVEEISHENATSINMKPINQSEELS